MPCIDAHGAVQFGFVRYRPLIDVCCEEHARTREVQCVGHFDGHVYDVNASHGVVHTQVEVMRVNNQKERIVELGESCIHDVEGVVTGHMDETVAKDFETPLFVRVGGSVVETKLIHKITPFRSAFDVRYVANTEKQLFAFDHKRQWNM